MRILFFLLLCCLSCEAQFASYNAVTTSGNSKMQSEQFGALWSDTFNNLNDWSTTGAATFTPTAGDLAVSSSTGDYTSYITYTPWMNAMDDYRIVVTYLATNRNTTSFGLGIGVRTANTLTGNNRSYLCALNQTSGANSGKVLLLEGSTQPAGQTTAASSSTGITFAANDQIELIFERTKGLYYVKATNLSNSPSTNFREISFNVTDNKENNSGHFAIWATGGTQTVQDISVSSKCQKNIRALFIGNSITHKVATTYILRYAYMTFLASTKTFQVDAGVGDYTAMFTGQTTVMAAYNADYTFIMLGGNDVFFGISSATYEADYTTIRNNIVANGSIPVHLLATPRDATDMTSLNTFISSTFTSDIVIDTFTPLKGAGTDLAAAYDSGDGVHPNAAGHALIATTIRTAMPYLY